MTIARKLPQRGDPAWALAAWPEDAPLVALWSAPTSAGTDPRWSRWTVLGRPVGGVCLTAADSPRLGRVHGFGQAGLRGGTDGAAVDPLVLLRELVDRTRLQRAPARANDAPPFVGGWIGCLHYELGRVVEPAAGIGSARPGATLMVWQRCPAAYAHDRRTGCWWAVGDERAVRTLPPLEFQPPGEDEFRCVAARPEESEAEYRRAVERTVEYIRAGDVFQANISHALASRFSGSSRSFFAALMERAAPWYGAYIEHGDPASSNAIVSASPEMFIELDPRTRAVTTRPIKGTRRAAGEGENELASSVKDAAELAMIVDLMRNDLGRVCEYGSIRVIDPRALERHGAPSATATDAGVIHGVATVTGRLRNDRDLVDLLRAAFPGGSITGAPKVRAMQIIDGLEQRPRGPYTGSIGYISDCGRACFNIAIRTASLHQPSAWTRPGWFDDARLEYPVGAGIVAESDPAQEWDETLAKADIIRTLDRAPLA